MEAAFTASKIPGPLRAHYQRVRARRGTQIAIVATARKLVCLCWTMMGRGEDYAFARQSLTDKSSARSNSAPGCRPVAAKKATPTTPTTKPNP